jgi:RimJ/RimL family protein N-acetyltransferase
MGTTVVAETERLTLRTFEPSDLDALAPIFSDSEVMRFSVRGPRSREDTRRFIEGCLADYAPGRWGFGLWAVVHRRDRRLIGYCGLTRFDDVDGSPEVEIGYRLSPRYWGMGLATEAATAVRDHAFRHLGMTRLISMIEPENTRSVRVAEKVGMTREKVIRKWDRPLLVYAIQARRSADRRRHAREQRRAHG